MKEWGDIGLTYVDYSIDSLSNVVLDSSVVSEALRATIDCARNENQGCRHSAFAFMHGEPTENKFLNSQLSMAEIRDLLEEHLPIDQRKHLPETAKQLGEALKRIEADLINIYGITMEKKKTTITCAKGKLTKKVTTRHLKWFAVFHDVEMRH